MSETTEAHNVQKVVFVGTLMLPKVDGKEYQIDIAKQSKRLAMATPQNKERFEISPAGSGIHCPDVDEDMSIDGLIGSKHTFPVSANIA